MMVRRLGPDPRAARLTVVALHGRDQTPDFMIDHVVRPLALDDVTWLLPAAPGGRWYPDRFDAGLERNEPALLGSVDHLLDAHADTGASPARTVWLGFSQGACVAAELVARTPLAWAGLVLLAGGRVGPDGIDLRPARRVDGLLVYAAVGDADEQAPVPRVRDTAEAFRHAGGDVELDVIAGHGHEVHAAQLAAVAALLQRAGQSTGGAAACASAARAARRPIHARSTTSAATTIISGS